jgi:glycosyltransferase involved in cell wall biosynthesis
MITIIVVTRNRAALLEECLASLSQQQAPGDWRVLVVNNGSSDDTDLVTARYSASNPRFSAILEAEPGASRARNRGATEASTPYLLYVDDECTFPDGYVALAQEIAARQQPACFGGPVLSRHHAHPPVPAWFKPDYGAFSLPHNNRPGLPPRLSAGNLGVSREALFKVDGFPESYGPVGLQMRYGEENAVIAGMWDRFGAERVVYEPKLINHHLVRPEKYSWRFILKDHFLRGLARGRLHAAGLGEDSRIHHGASSESVPPSRNGFALARLLGDWVLDVTLLRLITEPKRFPSWQNVVYERWMRYVAAVGVGVGYLKGKFEGQPTG